MARQTIVVGVDGEQARQAVRFALAEAVRRDAEVVAGADLLVVGHGGRGAPAGTVLGSAGLQCVLRASCPVTVVPASRAEGRAEARAEQPSPGRRLPSSPEAIRRMTDHGRPTCPRREMGNRGAPRHRGNPRPG
jgi:hypothetical protein